MKTLSIIFGLILIAVSAHGYEIDAGRSYGMAGSVVLSEPSASGHLACPSAMLIRDRLLVESGWQRRFELAELDQLFLSAGYRTGSISFSAGFSQFGKSNYYTEKIFRSTVTYNYKYFTGSLIGSGKIVEIGETYDPLRAASIGLGAGVNYGVYHLGITIDNLNRPKIVENRDGENILFDFYAEIEGGSFHTVTGTIRLEKNHDPYVGFGQYIYLYGNHAFFWGVSNNPLTYGGGVELAYRGVSFVYSANYHPTLGFTHNISINFIGGRNRER